MRPAPAALVVALLLAFVPVTVAAGAGGAAQTPACTGHSSHQPDGLTVVSVQGANGTEKTAARVVAYEPNGSIRWVHRNGRELGVSWSYDIDPLPNGNLFVTAAYRENGEGKTLLYELDRETGERVRTDRLDMLDTHDADVLNESHVVIANMRNYDAANETNDDRIVVYNRSSDEVVWEWRFADHYDESVGGDYTADWTHVNDVDAVGEHFFLVSPRNFDQVLLVDRRTGEISLRLGADGNHDVLYKQHNPDYLAGENGTPTLLVADSENNRIVEYAFHDGEWDRTWRAGSEATLYWPRDADRLPNGNTLVGDSRNSRVLELTPEGEVVWEVFAPYLVYDVERLPGDGSNGPTIAEQDAAGSVALANASPPSEERLATCSAAISAHDDGWGTTTPTNGTSTNDTLTATPVPETVNEEALATDSSVSAPLSPLLALVAFALVAASAMARD